MPGTGSKYHVPGAVSTTKPKQERPASAFANPKQGEQKSGPKPKQDSPKTETKHSPTPPLFEAKQAKNETKPRIVSVSVSPKTEQNTVSVSRGDKQNETVEKRNETSPKKTDKAKTKQRKAELPDAPEDMPQEVLAKALKIGNMGDDEREVLKDTFNGALTFLRGKSERDVWEYTRRHHRYSIEKKKAKTRASSYVRAYAGRVMLWNTWRHILHPNDGKGGASLIRPPQSLNPENAQFRP